MTLRTRKRAVLRRSASAGLIICWWPLSGYVSPLVQIGAFKNQSFPGCDESVLKSLPSAARAVHLSERQVAVVRAAAPQRCPGPSPRNLPVHSSQLGALGEDATPGSPGGPRGLSLFARQGQEVSVRGAVGKRQSSDSTTRGRMLLGRGRRGQEHGGSGGCRRQVSGRARPRPHLDLSPATLSFDFRPPEL